MSRINNTFQLQGYLGADPIKRFNQNNGQAIIGMSIGVDSSYKNRETGEVVERTEWIDVTVYREGLVNVIDQYVRKGSEITVRGHIRKRSWESKDRTNEDGSPRMESRYEFVVGELRLGRRPKGSEGGEGSGQQAPQDLEKANALANAAGAAASDFDDDIPY